MGYAAAGVTAAHTVAERGALDQSAVDIVDPSLPAHNIGAPPLFQIADTTQFADVTDPAFAGGADTSGTTDCTAALRAAADTDRPVFLPPGRYRFDGPAIDARSPRVVGSGQGATTVLLGRDTYFLESDRRWPQLLMQGIRFSGGLGHIRNTYTGVNVNDFFVVTDCVFTEYTGMSIANSSVDHPYWRVERNIFRAANCTSTIGVALSGLTDGSTISNNAFLANRVHLKVGRGGNNTYIYDNDFLRFLPYDGEPRVDVWFLPSPTDVNSGAGMVLTRCKFGNEGLAPKDWRIVYADPAGDHGPGVASWPAMGTESSGWIAGHTVANVLSNGIGDEALIPMIRSTTSKIVGGRYGPVTQAGNSGAPIMSTMHALAYPAENVFGPLMRASPTTFARQPLVVAGPG